MSAKKIHLIIDFQYLFHRHLYSIREAERSEQELGYRKGRRRLSWEVDGEELETSRVFYPLADFESIRRYWSKNNDVTISICMDSKSNRKEESAEYKANRKKLFDVDIDAVDRIKECLETAGYNVYKQKGMEADDIVGTLVKLYKNDYDFTVIYTPDSDLAIHVDEKVGLMRYKSAYSAMGGKSHDILNNHMAISINNYEQILSAEFKCKIPYNVIALYKATVGDTSDGISGIRGFGPKAFDNLIYTLECNGEDFRRYSDINYVESTLVNMRGYFGEQKLKEALESLELVKCRYTEVAEKVPEFGTDSKEKREKAYMKYGMASLCKE